MKLKNKIEYVKREVKKKKHYYFNDKYVTLIFFFFFIYIYIYIERERERERELKKGEETKIS